MEGWRDEEMEGWRGGEEAIRENVANTPFLFKAKKLPDFNRLDAL